MKILMIASGFELGGVTSAMRNLCNELVARGHCVDLLNLPGIAELPEDFDKRINVIHLSGFARNWNLSMTAVRDASGLRKLWLLLLGAFKKATNRGNLWHRIVFHGLKIKKHYDISIGFRQSPVGYWLAKYKCDSALSVGFWHTDADFENVAQLEDCLHYPDKICCVSDAITSQMKQKSPKHQNNSAVVGNSCRVICTCDEYIARRQTRMENYPVFDFWGIELNSTQRIKERELLSDVGEGFSDKYRTKNVFCLRAADRGGSHC